MKYIKHIPLFLSLIILGCKGQQILTQDEVSTSFQTILNNAVDDEELDISGVSMTVIAPDLEISWTGAAGYDSTTDDRHLSAEQPFRIASITKSFVAAAVLRLHEQGKLSIDDPISKYISEEYQQILKADQYNPEVITIQHCLLHRSGLFDYAMGNNAYVEAALQDPQRRWTRTEQLRFAMDHGEQLGPPGRVFGYSDTGYILVGSIIENVTGNSLALALRSLLKFDALNLSATWLESLEARPKGLLNPVHRYLEGMDATDWDNSIDLYGGGGLSSTTHDMATFFNALFNEGIYDQESTLALMVSEPGPLAEENKEGSAYRMGLWQINVFDTYGYMHNGLWGSTWVFVPAYNCTAVVNYTNDTQGAGILEKTLNLIKKWKIEKDQSGKKKP